MDSDYGFPVRKAIELTVVSLHNLLMSQISNQLLFQRVRNRVIEQLEFTAHFVTLQNLVRLKP